MWRCIQRNLAERLREEFTGEGVAERAARGLQRAARLRHGFLPSRPADREQGHGRSDLPGIGASGERFSQRHRRQRFAPRCREQAAQLERVRVATSSHDRGQYRIGLDRAMRWTGLDIVETTGGSAFHSEGTVTFRAHYTVNGRPGDLCERSRFVRHERGRGFWFSKAGADLNRHRRLYGAGETIVTAC